MEFYAELSRQMRDLLDSGDYILRLPPSAEYKRKQGSRCLFIECADDEQIVDMVEDALDASGVPFQRDDLEKED